MMSEQEEDEQEEFDLLIREKNETKPDDTVRVWHSTYEDIIGIKATMELASREEVSIPQLMDAIVSLVKDLKIRQVKNR